MKFTLQIELGNDAMRTLGDVARSFADAVNRFHGSLDLLEDGDGQKILDANGNTVGKWEVTE